MALSRSGSRPAQRHPRLDAGVRESHARAVIVILSHSLTCLGRGGTRCAREADHAARADPGAEKDLLSQLEAVYNEQHVLTGYHWKKSGKLYTRDETVSHFFCPGCGGQIKAKPGKLHEREQRSDEEEQQFAALKKGQQEEEEAESDSLEPVAERAWFTLKPRWCRCRADARNQPGPRNPAGRSRVRTPLWTDARLETAQRKHPQLPFAASSARWNACMGTKVTPLEKQWRSLLLALSVSRQEQANVRRSAWDFLSPRGKARLHSATMIQAMLHVNHCQKLFTVRLPVPFLSWVCSAGRNRQSAQ